MAAVQALPIQPIAVTIEQAAKLIGTNRINRFAGQSTPANSGSPPWQILQHRYCRPHEVVRAKEEVCLRQRCTKLKQIRRLQQVECRAGSSGPIYYLMEVS